MSVENIKALIEMLRKAKAAGVYNPMAPWYQYKVNRGSYDDRIRYPDGRVFDPELANTVEQLVERGYQINLSGLLAITPKFLADGGARDGAGRPYMGALNCTFTASTWLGIHHFDISENSTVSVDDAIQTFEEHIRNFRGVGTA